MTIDVGARRRAYGSYRGASFTTRAVAARPVVAPVGPLSQEARPFRGRMRSLGSGVGIAERHLAERNPDVTIEGIDLDPARAELIRSTRERSPRVTLRHGDATDLDEPETYDAVLVGDVVRSRRP